MSPLSLDGAMTVKAKAFHSDYTASAETSRAYTLAAPAPRSIQRRVSIAARKT
jgi:hypothetical protein